MKGCGTLQPLSMRSQPLFGDAIQCVVGDTFLDARYENGLPGIGTWRDLTNDLPSQSEIRQIPDNQEVFVDIRTQQSIIFELLEPVDANNEDIARYTNIYMLSVLETVADI